MVMYITGSYSGVFAVEHAKPKKQQKKKKKPQEALANDARLPDGIMPCFDVINRGWLEMIW